MKNESGYRYFNRMIAQNCVAGKDRSKAKRRRSRKRRKNDASVVIYGDRRS